MRDSSRIQSFLTRLALAAPQRKRWQRMLFAVCCVLAATLLRIYCFPILGDVVPWILFYPAVLFAAWYGGRAAGLMATLLSILAAHYLWAQPEFATDLRMIIATVLFTFAGILISYLSDMWHNALQAEAASKAELEHQVQARTAELQEKIAELESFSYTLSHDLRAPLRAVQSFSEILDQDYGGLLEPRAREFLLRVRRAAARMDRLILDVLNYSRTGDSNLILEAVDLTRIVKDVLEEYPAVAESGAEITVGQLHPVLGNHALLLQCVSNLVCNAVKFVAPDVRPQVRIWTERHDGLVRLHVADRGIGIPEKYITKLGQPFERIHPERGYEGTGIGLAIVRKAVARMHGRFGVESKVDQGSTFWIELASAHVSQSA